MTTANTIPPTCTWIKTLTAGITLGPENNHWWYCGKTLADVLRLLAFNGVTYARVITPGCQKPSIEAFDLDGFWIGSVLTFAIRDLKPYGWKGETDFHAFVPTRNRVTGLHITEFEMAMR